ncbi:hypothetical protein [Pectobacterium parmentieri]|uniref:hypothetical protein n=1 Tax=Pectobacterium parmentieri TaxID=1905730 RepID=UPI0013C45DA5|nr:hypothetical protein [Pectobacterium parmentieri]
MSPEQFIRKHITAVLVAEGFPLNVAGGGGQQTTALSITAECHRPARKEMLLMIVCSAPVSGRWGKPQQQREKQAKEKPERVAPLTGYFDLGVSS